MTNGLCPFMQPPHVFYLQWIEVAGCTPWQRTKFQPKWAQQHKKARPFFSGSLYSFYTWKKVMVNKVCVCVCVLTHRECVQSSTKLKNWKRFFSFVFPCTFYCFHARKVSLHSSKCMLSHCVTCWRWSYWNVKWTITNSLQIFLQINIQDMLH